MVRDSLKAGFLAIRYSPAGFFVMSRESVEETRSHLLAACGLNYINKNTFNHLDKQYQNPAKGVNSFVSSIRHKKQNQK